MLRQLAELEARALGELDAVTTAVELDSWRVRYLGRKSELTQMLRQLAALPLDEKKAVGGRANEIKQHLGERLAAQEQALRDRMMSAVEEPGSYDITLPGRPWNIGRFHPITQTVQEISAIFNSMGFQTVEGPEVEWAHYNFEALNIPPEHPSRDNMSTFWLAPPSLGVTEPMLLRTHTTSVSARSLEKMRPPIRVIAPGKVYRYEASDATHTTMFHQIDGIVVDKHITMADLKGTLYEFARRFFGEDRKVRFRCDYFPFVEPGVEMAISCIQCGGTGCRICKGSGWIEILGAGMTHPEVLRHGGLDPEEYTSFAFGIGLDRLPILRYGIDDTRYFYNNDLRFLRQF